MTGGTPNPRVDAYLETLPPDQRELLQGLRARIARVVPEATETMSYGMPAFKLNGRFLVSFAGWKDHCSIYPLTGEFLENHAAALKGYGRTKGSLHFTPDAPIPESLLDELIRGRIGDLEGGQR